MPIALYIDTLEAPHLDNYGFQTLMAVFNLTDNPPQQGANQRWLLTVRDRLYTTGYPHEYLFILSTAADYDANAEQYDAILRYFNTYQFYTNLRLRYTLFLTEYSNENYSPIYFGYPDKWVEYMNDEGVVTVVPDGFDPNDSNAPAIRLYDVSHLDSASQYIEPEMLGKLADEYNLSDEALTTLTNRFFPNGRTIYCEPTAVEPVMYERDGRRGYISAVSHYYIEVSAPIEQFDTYADVLRLVPASMSSPFSMCG